MTIQLFVLDQAKEELKGKAFYIPEEFTFMYETKFLSGGSELLLIFDTLTMVFDSNTKNFISLDAYTNIEQWQLHEKISFPKISTKGSLIVKGFEDHETDRVSFGFMPEFEYTKEGIVKIKFSNDSENSCHFYQISREGFVCLKGTKLVSFIFQNVNLKR